MPHWERVHSVQLEWTITHVQHNDLNGRDTPSLSRHKFYLSLRFFCVLKLTFLLILGLHWGLGHTREPPVFSIPSRFSFSLMYGRYETRVSFSSASWTSEWFFLYTALPLWIFCVWERLPVCVHMHWYNCKYITLGIFAPSNGPCLSWISVSPWVFLQEWEHA